MHFVYLNAFMNLSYSTYLFHKLAHFHGFCLLHGFHESHLSHVFNEFPHCHGFLIFQQSHAFHMNLMNFPIFMVVSLRNFTICTTSPWIAQAGQRAAPHVSRRARAHSAPRCSGDGHRFEPRPGPPSPGLSRGAPVENKNMSACFAATSNDGHIDPCGLDPAHLQL